MPSGPKKRRAAAKKKKAVENLNSNHANNFQEINTNPDSTAAVNENTAVVILSAIPTADSSDHSPKEDVPDELNGGVKLVMKENDTASVVPAAFSVDLPNAAGYLPKDVLSSIDKDMITDAIALADCIPEGTVESNEDFKQELKENDVKFEFAENSPKEDVPDELNEGVKLVMKENDTASVVPADFSVDLPNAAGDLPKDGLSSIDKDMIADAIALADCIPEGNVESNEDFKQDLKENDMKFEFAENSPKEDVPDELNEGLKLVMKENDTASVVPAAFSVDLPNAAGDLPKDGLSSIDKDMIADAIALADCIPEGTVESNEDFKQDLKEHDMKFEFAENLPKEGIHVEFNEDSKLGFKPNDSTMLPSVDDQIPLTSTVALPTDTDLNITTEKVANLVPENPNESSKFPLPIDPSVEEDYEKAFESPNDFDIFNQSYTSERQLEHFKKKIIDELKATDKMRAFLQKVLDDLNSMQLRGSGTGSV